MIFVGQDLLKRIAKSVVQNIEVLILRVILNIKLVEKLVALIPIHNMSLDFVPFSLPATEDGETWTDFEEYVVVL